MKQKVFILYLIIVLTFSIAFSEVYYCVQVASSKRLQDLIPLFQKYRSLDNVRIEKIGDFFALRIGFYKNKNDVLKVASEVKNSLVRKCDYKPSRIVYPEPKLKKEEVKEERTENFDKENFFTLLEKNIEELKVLTKKVAEGSKEGVKPFKELESIVVGMYEQKEKSYKRALPLYINGEFWYRGKALTGEDLLGDKWYGYLGLKLSFFRRGFADFKYERERAKFSKLFSQFDIQNEFAYLLSLQNQEESFTKGLNYELSVINKEKERTLKLLKKWVKFTESYDKSLGFPYREIVKEKEISEIKTQREGFFLKPLKVNLEEFMKYYEKKKKEIMDYLDEFKLTTKDKWFYLRHTDLNLFARYYLAGRDGNSRDFWALGLRFELPIPYMIKDLGKVDKLEILSFKERALLAYGRRYSFFLDYISRINRNYSNIVNHLENINVDFLEIEREMYFWKNGLREVNYTLILRNLLDIYHRLSQIVYLKYINYVYIQKLIYFMGIKDLDTIRRIING